MRDGIETANLIDYFTIDPKLVSQWREADDKERWKRFKPVSVRAALGKRDGKKLTERRDEVYKVFSTYASHASPKGFRLLRPTPNGLALIGPFFEPTALTALFGEFAKNNVPFCDASGAPLSQSHPYRLPHGYRLPENERQMVCSFLCDAI